MHAIDYTALLSGGRGVMLVPKLADIRRRWHVKDRRYSLTHSIYSTLIVGH